VAVHDRGGRQDLVDPEVQDVEALAVGAELAVDGALQAAG